MVKKGEGRFSKKFSKYDLDELILAVNESTCWSDVCRKLGVTICTFNFNKIKERIKDNNIDCTHFNSKSAMTKHRLKWDDESIFVENCTIHRSGLRPVLIRLGFYTGECGECGVGDEWNSKPLIIEIDHINGDCTDNRKDNLRWLCPNCHSQTKTYRNRLNNRQVVGSSPTRPTKSC